MNAYRETCDQCMNRKLLDETKTTAIEKKSEPKQLLGIISRAAIVPGCSLGIATTVGLWYSILHSLSEPHIWSILSLLYMTASLIIGIVYSVDNLHWSLPSRLTFFSWAPFAILIISFGPILNSSRRYYNWVMTGK